MKALIKSCRLKYFEHVGRKNLSIALVALGGIQIIQLMVEFKVFYRAPDPPARFHCKQSFWIM